jgi:hypothetical protein
MQVKNKAMSVSKSLIRLMGLFNPMMKELVEMMYQNDRDYFFDSKKFRKKFPEFEVTPYQQGVREVVAAG